MTPVGKLLKATVARTVPARAREFKLELTWSEIAGREIAARTHARLDGARVIIEVGDESWAREIRGLRGILRSRLEAELGGVKDVEVVVTPGRASIGRKAGRPASGRESPSRPTLVPVTLPAEIEERLGQIADTALRDQLRATMSRYIAGTRSRQEAEATERRDHGRD